MRGLYTNIIASSYQQVVTPPIITTNLKLHYDFTDPACYSGTGNVVYDLTTNNHDMTFVNAASWQGSYFDFDGVNDYGQITNYGNAPIVATFSFWFRPNASWVNTDAPMRLAGWNVDYEMMRWGGSITQCGTRDPGEMVFDIGGPNYMATDNSTWLNNTWYNVTAIWNRTAGTSSVYINGVFDRAGCPPGTASTSSTQLTIGRSQGNINQYFDGDLGWLAIYSDELTSAEVLQNFNATKANYGY